MHRAFCFFLLLSVLVMAQAQLTFSTDWGNGKRSARSEQGDCATEESIYTIYKLIQREAEKFLACQTDGKN